MHLPQSDRERADHRNRRDWSERHERQTAKPKSPSDYHSGQKQHGHGDEREQPEGEPLADHASTSSIAPSISPS
jgi:hypothetical protein